MQKYHHLTVPVERIVQHAEMHAAMGTLKKYNANGYDPFGMDAALAMGRYLDCVWLNRCEQSSTIPYAELITDLENFTRIHVSRFDDTEQFASSLALKEIFDRIDPTVK